MNIKNPFLKININKKLKMKMKSQKLNIMRLKKISKINYNQDNNKFKINYNIIINFKKINKNHRNRYFYQKKKSYKKMKNSNNKYI